MSRICIYIYIMHSDRDNNISHHQIHTMEINPVYEFIKSNTDHTSSLSDSGTNVLQPASTAGYKQATKRKISGQTCVSASVAVLALLVLAGVVVTVILRPQLANTESNVGLDSLKQELESLKELTGQQANVTNELTKIIRFQESEIDSLKLNSQHSNENTTELRSEIESLKQHFNASNYQTHIQLILNQQNLTTTEVANVQQFVMAKIDEMKHNVTERIKVLQTSSSESIQELKLLLRTSNETITAEIENVQMDCLKKANETQYSIYNVTQDIKILQTSSSESIQELKLLLRTSNETITAEIENVKMDCLKKANETQYSIYNVTQDIKILQTSSSESIQELKLLLRTSNETITAEIENVQMDCLKKANETQYSIYNVTQDIKILQTSSSESIQELKLLLRTSNETITAEIENVKMDCLKKANETQYSIYNVTQDIKGLQTSSSESIQELKLLLRTSNETITAEIENVQMDCLKKANETQYSVYNVTQDIKILQKSSSESIQELKLLLRTSNETFTSDIDNLWERQNQNAFHCMVKVNETRNEAEKKTQKINGRIDQLVENFTSDVEAIRIQVSTLLNATGPQGNSTSV